MSNIKKIQDMISGKYRERVSIGYEGKTTNQRKEGEEWVDARGRSWTIKDGKRKQITKVPPRGFDKCNGWEGSDCRKLILKTIDQETYNRMGRCRICQLEFEADLHRKGKWNVGLPRWKRNDGNQFLLSMNKRWVKEKKVLL